MKRVSMLAVLLGVSTIALGSGCSSVEPAGAAGPVGGVDSVEQVEASGDSLGSAPGESGNMGSGVRALDGSATQGPQGATNTPAATPTDSTPSGGNPTSDAKGGRCSEPTPVPWTQKHDTKHDG